MISPKINMYTVATLKSRLSLFLKMTRAARIERKIDQQGVPEKSIALDHAIELGVAWLCRAQDHSASNDGGVANYSLLSGWSASYPETTGYIVPTMLEYARYSNDEAIRERARRMLNWLVHIQLPEGGFQCGLIGSKPAIPVTFNTGQILLGLTAGVSQFGDQYRLSMCRAADWLVQTQDADGCWRKHSSPLTSLGVKSYETHVAWGLFEAARIVPTKGYAEAAIANVRWAISQQNDNGWFRNCCVTNPEQPLTHTIGYVFRGLIEAYLFHSNSMVLESCEKLANGLTTVIREDGFLPGRLKSDWSSEADWACLTGSVQIAHALILLYQVTQNVKYRDAAYSLNLYVRRTMQTTGDLNIIGGIKASFPIDGGYIPYGYPNWACKFFVDSHLAEIRLRVQEAS